MFNGWFSYWMLPLFSAVVWLAMLLAMLLTWITEGKPIYPSMQGGQTIAYISDVGAEKLKPLFITMGAVSVITFDIAFLAERWLRHSGRLVRNTSVWQKILSFGSIIFSIVGAAGLILLTIFDTLRHNVLHNIFLAFFIGGYVISAVFTCWEYQRLGKHFRQFRILRASFWVKLAFIFVEVGLAIAFGVLNRTKKWNNAAIVEWVIALVYTFYVLSFALDFVPAAKQHAPGHAKSQMNQNGSNFVDGPVMAHDDAAYRYAEPQRTSGHWWNGYRGDERV